MTSTPGALNADLAIKSYIGDPDWMFKTGLGGVLNAACLLLALMDLRRFLFVPIGLACAALIAGYIIRSVKQKLNDPSERLPEWNQWGDLFFSGLNWIAVQFCLTILAAGPITVTLIVSSFSLAAYSTNPVAVGIIVGLTGVCVLGLFLGAHLITSYLLISFAQGEKLSSGFDGVKVIRAILREPKNLITAWIISFELQVLAVVVPSITVVGAFFVPSTLFASQLVGSSLMAQAWRLTEKS